MPYGEDATRHETRHQRGKARGVGAMAGCGRVVLGARAIAIVAAVHRACRIATRDDPHDDEPRKPHENARFVRVVWLWL